MRHLTVSLAALCVLVAPGCLFGSRTRTTYRGQYISQQNYSRLQAGASAEEVYDLFGEPTTKSVRADSETWQDVLRLQSEGVEPAAFAAIRAPVLMLHGDRDPHPGAATRDLLQRFMPHIDYVEFERCGHEPWRERHARDPFLRTLREWLTSTSARR